MSPYVRVRVQSQGSESEFRVRVQSQGSKKSRALRPAKECVVLRKDHMSYGCKDSLFYSQFINYMFKVLSLTDMVLSQKILFLHFKIFLDGRPGKKTECS